MLAGLGHMIEINNFRIATNNNFHHGEILLLLYYFLQVNGLIV